MRLLDYKPITLMLLVVAANALAQPKDACLAFLLKADVMVLCGNQTTQVTHRRNIESFAVSEERSALAFTSPTPPSRGATRKGAYTANVIDLKTGSQKASEGIESLVSTCGSILTNPLRVDTGVRDVVTGEDLSFRPYVRFRCSADRKVIAGITKDASTDDHQSDLYEGIPPATKLAAFADVDAYYFGVSPNAAKIAYFNDVRPLCVISRPGGTQCVDHSTISDPVSVNDLGEVLVATGTGRGCNYRTSYDFSPAASPTGGDDECLGIGYWKPGMKAIVFITPLGRNPQWISPGMAATMIRWSVKPGRGIN